MMDENIEYQDAVLNWAAGASRFDRLAFLKKYMRFLTEDEAQVAKLFASHRRRYFKRKYYDSLQSNTASDSASSVLPKFEEVPASAPVSVSVPVSSSALVPELDPQSVFARVPQLEPQSASIHVPQYEAASSSAKVPSICASALVATVESDPESAPVSVSIPVSASPTVNQDKLQFWWRKWKKTEIVSIDVEKVTLTKKEPGQKRATVAAATISVVDFNGNEVYANKVKYKRGEFLVNRFTRSVNGFELHSLENGNDLKDVMKGFLDVLDGKLVITVAGELDFQSLGLSSVQLDHFDLQWYWFERVLNQNMVSVEQPIGLRHIYHHYFGIDIQSGVHEARIDAEATMRLFREIYVNECKDKNITTIKNPEPFTDFPRLRQCRNK